MSLMRIFGAMAVAWAALFTGGNLAIGALTDDGRAEARATTVEMARVENTYTRCLKMSYAVNSNGQASELSHVKVLCDSQSEGFTNGLIKAGFVPQQAEAKVRNVAAETYQHMRRLMPPCEKGEHRLQVS